MQFLADVRAVRLADCNLTDAAASLLVDSVLGGTATRALDFKGIEMGANFVNSIDAALENDPYCLEELGMAGVRAQVSLGYLIRALLPCRNLTHLDLTRNAIHETVAEDVATLVRETPALEYLNLSSCALRGRASEVLLDGLAANESVSYLILDTNSFASRDHLLAAKLGRLLQGHPGLLHVNLSHCQLGREELLYLALCIRDSKNIQGIHLTGNRYSHYDRRLMRGLFPAKVRWPQPGGSAPKYEKISARDKMTLVMLNTCFLGAIPPPYMPEVGMSAVHTVDEIKGRLRSHEMRSAMQGKLEAAETGPDAEVKRAVIGVVVKERGKETRYGGYSRELVLERLAEVQRTAHTRDAAGAGSAREAGIHRSRLAVSENKFTDDSLAEPSARAREVEKFNLGRYLNDPDARTYDLFSMLDFYGRKKRCLEMGKPLTNQDAQWPRDQKHRLRQRKDARGQTTGVARRAGRSGAAGAARSVAGTPRQPPGSALAVGEGGLSVPNMAEESRRMRKEVEFREHHARDTEVSSLMTDAEEGAPGLASGESGGTSPRSPRRRGPPFEARDEGIDQHTLTIERVKRLLAMPPEQVPEPGGAANPMNGHAQELVFSRVTGHPDYVDTNQWFDASECWICDRWSKCAFRVANCHAMPDQEFAEVVWLGAHTRRWA